MAIAGKKELASKVAKKAQVTIKEAEDVIEATLDTITEELKQEDGKVTLKGFGVFSVASRPERQGRNPQSGEPMKIAASRSAKFKPGKLLKDSINQA